ncbi:protein of unknown function [Paenibacillus sp. yr247]|uniref:DUF5054 domain-containing protein n=1 Tax=Paenibacillus sp. yr247 TaxID=1761880 RepID=UPI000881AEFB|nr:DUF5054 domain-containing protein [Paenibacillus sp. yr247]SDO22609.1 protein of unknown function [Paenibacillus sp. yr247]
MTTIKRLHVIFKTHLDIGFTDLAERVLERYMTQFIPQALDLSEQLALEEGNVKFVWTTGSWLINEFLTTAQPEMRDRMEKAIRENRIVWHGLPFTTHRELMDAKLFEFGISLSRKLDERYGKKTIAAKMTDVTGHTIGMVPILERNNIQFLHLGANPVCKHPQVPPVFVWRAADGSELVVNYTNDYGTQLQIEGLEDALYFAYTGDNHGPPSIEDVRKLYALLQEKYPEATIMASTLDAFAEKILELKHQLPVITEEIGDSWIHGAASDPWKIARYRELLRLRDQWIDAGKLDPQSESYAVFCNRLMLVPEHTWGMNEHVYLLDYDHYSAANFAAARARDKVSEPRTDKYAYLSWPAKAERSYSMFESSWKEQRDYLDQALAALDDALAAEAGEAFERMKPGIEHFSENERVTLEVNECYDLGQFRVSFGSDGSINELVDSNGKLWADDEHRLGIYSYETFAKENYDRFFKEYVTNLKVHHRWADNDLGKPGLEYAEPRPEHKRYFPVVKSLYLIQKSDRSIVLAELKLPSFLYEQYGTPRKMTIAYTFLHTDSQIEVELHAMEKPACRLPESAWLSFVPLTDSPHHWKMEKLGARLSPLFVVKDGNRNMHSVENGIYYEGPEGSIALETLDAPVVCPGEPRLLQFDNSFAPLDGGFHFNLHNNVWGTNFAMWFEDEMKYRFRLTLLANRML